MSRSIWRGALVPSLLVLHPALEFVRNMTRTRSWPGRAGCPRGQAVLGPGDRMLGPLIVSGK